MLANQGGLEPFFDQPLTRPRDRVDTGLQRRRHLAVAPALTPLRGVGFQQDPGLQQLLCWMVSAMDKGGEMLSLLIAQCHYVFLYRDLFPGHQSAPSAAMEPSSQTNTAESMTGATRVTRIGLEAGPLSQWLYAGLVAAGFEVVLLETRHVKAALSAMTVKTDRKDARGIAQLLRMGWYRPVHAKSVGSQEVRALLVGRKLLQAKLLHVELSIRGILRGFGLKVGEVSRGRFEARI